MLRIACGMSEQKSTLSVPMPVVLRKRLKAKSKRMDVSESKLVRDLITKDLNTKKP